MKHIIIYTDGACRGNPGKGGWGALIVYQNHRKSLSGHVPHTTNNRMELTAAIEALKVLREPCRVELFTDSQYLQKGMTTWLHKWKQNGWKTADKKAVKNAELWQALHDAMAGHEVTWHWVKGHAGHPENEYVDSLANQAIDDAGTAT